MAHRLFVPILVALVAVVARGETPDVLRRAVAALGGDEVLQKARSISIVMVGTQDLSVRLRIHRQDNHRTAAGAILPSSETPQDLAAMIVDQVKATTGKRVCYVVPTHHHADHFGAVGGLARAGATIVTTAGNEVLARKTAKAAGVDNPRIEIVRDHRVLGPMGVIRNEPHSEESIFVHFPQHRVAFDGDLCEYVPSAWNLLRYVDRNRLAIDRVYRSHGRPVPLNDLQWEEPGN